MVVHQETDQEQCSEGKPVCGRCTRLQKACVYLSAGTTAAQSDITRPGHLHCSPNAKMYSMSTDVIQSDLANMLAPSSVVSIGGRGIGSNLRALQHFQCVTSLSLGGELLRHVMHTVVAQTAWSKPYLMHMVLAVSTAHLKRLHAPHVRGHCELILAEAIHWQHGLQMYQAQLTGKTEIPNRSRTDFD